MDGDQWIKKKEKQRTVERDTEKSESIESTSLKQPHTPSTSVDLLYLHDNQLQMITNSVVESLKGEFSKMTQLILGFSNEQKDLLNELQNLSTRLHHIERLHTDTLVPLKASLEEGVKALETHIEQHLNLSKILCTLEILLKRL